ncbi:signal peptidase I [Nocardioides sp. SYSU D00038]|uniref:signal peptidase I n=1 Tax=Nocardioides sp. SYSU D00038 TaxID=2812554 RepID=UPI00196887EE|nr:signal peptidase I [Nocardioides sp. SYSU D00038]
MSDGEVRPRQPAGKVVRETVLLLVFAVLLALVVKTFLVQSFYIPSESMEPGLQVNDRILVQKPSYWFGGEPQRGDVVVFDDPGDWLAVDEPEPSGVAALLAKIGLYPTGGHLVKRVIGVGGDTIECCDEEGRLSVNGTALDEDSFIDPQTDCDGPMKFDCSWTAGPVPDGMLFVMGDNRDDSADSTVHLCREKNPGCDPEAAYVPVDLVVGKVFALVWPPGRADLTGRPDVFDSVADPASD